MKTTRRGAFGIGAGGLVAGPGLVQEAVNQASEYAKDNPTPSQYEGPQTTDTFADKVAEQAKYLARRKQELQDIINGKYNEYQTRELNNRAFSEVTAKLNIESLKSISDTYKHQMLVDKWKERQINQWQKEAKISLARLLSGDRNFII